MTYSTVGKELETKLRMIGLDQLLKQVIQKGGSP
jgi:hypothetical protein